MHCVECARTKASYSTLKLKDVVGYDRVPTGLAVACAVYV